MLGINNSSGIAKITLLGLALTSFISCKNVSNQKADIFENTADTLIIPGYELESKKVKPDRILDTTAVIKSIRKKYYYMVKNKSKAEIEFSESFESHKDSESDGDYSERTMFDSTFHFNDTLSLYKTVAEGDNHINSFYEKEESFFHHNKRFFEFHQSYRYMHQLDESVIEEKRYYYHDNEAFQLLTKKLFIKGCVNKDFAADSLSKLRSNNSL